MGETGGLVDPAERIAPYYRAPCLQFEMLSAWLTQRASRTFPPVKSPSVNTVLDRAIP